MRVGYLLLVASCIVSALVSAEPFNYFWTYDGEEKFSPPVGTAVFGGNAVGASCAPGEALVGVRVHTQQLPARWPFYGEKFSPTAIANWWESGHFYASFTQDHTEEYATDFVSIQGMYCLPIPNLFNAEPRYVPLFTDDAKGTDIFPEDPEARLVGLNAHICPLFYLPTKSGICRLRFKWQNGEKKTETVIGWNPSSPKLKAPISWNVRCGIAGSIVTGFKGLTKNYDGPAWYQMQLICRTANYQTTQGCEIQFDQGAPTTQYPIPFKSGPMLAIPYGAGHLHKTKLVELRTQKDWDAIQQHLAEKHCTYYEAGKALARIRISHDVLYILDRPLVLQPPAGVERLILEVVAGGSVEFKEIAATSGKSFNASACGLLTLQGNVELRVEDEDGNERNGETEQVGA